MTRLQLSSDGFQNYDYLGKAIFTPFTKGGLGGIL
jgi:hypothetical protein